MPLPPFLVNVTGDYPDAVTEAKTPVIARLCGLIADDFRQQVISLNRRQVTWRSLVGHAPVLQPVAADNGCDTFTYRAFARGLFHRTRLEQVGEELAAKLARGPRPDMLIGHKLTIEGVIVHRAADLLDVPYALSIQGNTDTKILRARPDLLALFGRIYRGAAVVFPFAPWAQKAVEAKIGGRTGPTVALPCAMLHDQILAPRVGDGLVTAFHLHGWRHKNLAGMARALPLARQFEPGVALAVVGTGTMAERRAAHAAGGSDLEWEGGLPPDEIAARLNRAKGFVLPSKRESFGLVFLEALFAGTPIVYPAGRAVDGYFDGCGFALRVDPRDDRAIGEAMARLTRDEVSIKRELLAWQGSAAARRFTRPAIARTFADALLLAIRGEHVGGRS